MAYAIAITEAKKALATLLRYQELDIEASASETNLRKKRIISMMVKGRHNTISALKKWIERNEKN